MLLERGIDPGDVVYFDTGWDFPQIYDHLEKLEKFTGITFVRLRTEKPFDYWMFEYEYEHRDGEIVRGYGFPTFKTRWCTRMKQDTISSYWEKTGKPVKYVGIAYDERHRVKSAESGRLAKENQKYPLIEWEITEHQALIYCYEKGFDWGGLYNHFDRVSCWCCPFKTLDELRMLYRYYPDLWKQLLERERKARNTFKPDASAFDLDRRFKEEQMQLCIF